MTTVAERDRPAMQWTSTAESEHLCMRVVTVVLHTCKILLNTMGYVTLFERCMYNV